MLKNSKVLPSRARELAARAKTEAVRADADSTQERINTRRKSTRLRKRKAPETDTSDDSNQVSGSQARRVVKPPKLDVQHDKGLPKQKETTSKMGRQIPLTFTAHGKTQCEITTVESSHPLPLHAVTVSEDDPDVEDNNVLLREWLELKANKGNLSGLQWYDKSQQLVKISWKHGSKSGWTTSDSQVFISWARCTGRFDPDNKGGFKRWKANFRCALNSLPDVEEVKEESGMKTTDPYKVYRLLDPISHRRSRRFASDPLPVRNSHKPLLAPATTSRLSVYPHQPVMLPALSTFLPPPNPSAPTFAGWFLSDGAPLGCVTQTVSLQPCCGDYRVTLDDHCYADKKCSVPGQTTDAACNTPIPTMVERLNGETSDEDGEDSDADCNTVNSSVHSTTAVHSDQPRCNACRSSSRALTSSSHK